MRTGAWPVWSSLADPIVFEFGAGVLIAVLARHDRLPRPLLAAACVTLGAAGLLWSPPGSAPGLRPVLWGIPAALVVLGTVSLEPSLRNRVPRWLLLLGSASYAIYLIQIFVFPVVDAAALRLRAIFPSATSWLLGTGIVICSVLAAAAAGVATHLLIERPITEFLKRRFGTDRIAPIARDQAASSAK